MEPLEADDIDQSTVLEVNIASIALDERFGNLKFESANTKLSKVQEWLKEARDLDYKKLLLPEHISNLQNYTDFLVEKLKWLCSFDISTTAGNPRAEHDQFESQVDSFYNGVYESLKMKYLPFLREERRLENPEEKKVDEEVRKAAQLRADLENELKKVRVDIEQIKNTKQEVAAAKGERGAAWLAAHFQAEVSTYQGKADGWYKIGTWFYGGIIFAIVGIAIYYTGWGNWSGISWQSAGSKLVFFAALWYGLSFLIRNYNVNSHLAAVNRHRAAVAMTLEDFLATNSERQAEMLKNATEAMFKNSPVGYITKAEKDSGNPILEVVNKVIGSRNGE